MTNQFMNDLTESIQVLKHISTVLSRFQQINFAEHKTTIKETRGKCIKLLTAK
jgi:hypothetical protein